MSTPLLNSATVVQLRDINARSLTMPVVLRRGTAALTTQSVYIDPSSVSQGRSDGGEAATGQLRLYGRHDMDIAQGDRLTYVGSVYEVVYVWPDRDVLTVAAIEVRQ